MEKRMYVPEHFAQTDIETLHRLIDAHSLGVLVTGGPAGLDANHLPFLLERDSGRYGTLHCHVARNNPVWRELLDDDEVLVIFRAADAYISPNWYPSKHEAHQQVPTWNYCVVHAHGRVRVRDDERYVRRVVAKLTQRHEASEPQPWKMGDAPPDYLDAMLKAIVGIEIEVTRLVGKSKLSQNKEAGDMLNAGQVLVDRAELAIGEAMLREARKKPPNHGDRGKLNGDLMQVQAGPNAGQLTH